MKKESRAAQVKSEMSQAWYQPLTVWETCKPREESGNVAPFFDLVNAQHDTALQTSPVIDEMANTIPVSAVADPAPVCEFCGDKFYKAFRDDVQEWVFKDAVRVGASLYHPACAPK